MSGVIMTKFEVEPSVLEELANGQHAETLRRLAEVGKRSGAVHHQFLQDEGGAIYTLDEWDSEDSYHRFFEGQEDIRRVMADARVTAQPVSTTYRIMSTPDAF
jgi:non-canonical (house-cleaning) NTP pyrophosphatase